jgi:hypothetical protein
MLAVDAFLRLVDRVARRRSRFFGNDVMRGQSKAFLC